MMPQILASIQHALAGAARLRAISLFGAFSGVGTVSGQVIDLEQYPMIGRNPPKDDSTLPAE